MSEKMLTNKDLRKMYFRGFLHQFTFNYPRMQAHGFLNEMTVLFEKLYKDSPKEDKVRAMKRHLEFYNNHATTNYLVMGATAALEEATTEEEKESVSSVKTGLMGPLAGIGDSLFKTVLYPIVAGFAANLALQGNVLGPIILLIVWNIINQGAKWILLKTGYEQGVKIFTSSKGNEIIRKVSTFASVVGVFVISKLMCSSVSAKVVFQTVINETVVDYQSALNALMPNLIPILTVVLCYAYLKKTNGKGMVKSMYVIMAIAVVLGGLGILG